MHLYIATRGIKNWVEQFITELQGKYCDFKYPNEKGELTKCSVQVAVRPIQLWEIVFPEESKDVMLATILNEHGGTTQHKRHNKFIWALRKMLGVKPIPEYKSDVKFPISLAHTEIVGIGIKEDYWVNPKTGEKIINPTEEQKKECFEGL